jgi:hypothetical protein
MKGTSVRSLLVLQAAVALAAVLWLPVTRPPDHAVCCRPAHPREAAPQVASGEPPAGSTKWAELNALLE